MQADPTRRRVIVHGRVQGVFFRDTLRQEARTAEVAGWVRNRDDGALEAVLEGAPEAVERLLQLCRTGPPRAHVEHVDVHAEPPEGLTSFEVR